MISSLIRSLFLLFVPELRERHTTLMSVIGELVGVGSTLAILWYMSQAFGSNETLKNNLGAPNYFSYLVLGETSLALPAAAIGGIVAKIQMAQADGILAALFLLPWRRVFVLPILLAPSLLYELAHSLFIFAIAAIFFHFQVTLVTASGWFLVQFVGFPTFLGVGLIAAGIFLKYGRGQGLPAVFLNLGTILGGVYFPTSLLPAGLHKWVDALLPLNLFFNSMRTLFSSGYSSHLLYTFAPLALCGGISLILGWLLISVGVDTVYKRGTVETY